MSGTHAVPEESFEVFDDTGASLGLVPRSEVHRRGFWHRSAHVFLFDSNGAMLVQRRAATKDLYAGRWDYSVGEHLLPGESFEAGALRGLAEELGVRGVGLTPLGPRRRFRLETEGGVIDAEEQQAFRGVCNGPFAIDPVEVAEVRLVAPVELARWIARDEGAFTAWFVRDLRDLDLLKAR